MFKAPGPSDFLPIVVYQLIRIARRHITGSKSSTSEKAYFKAVTSLVAGFS